MAVFKDDAETPVGQKLVDHALEGQNLLFRQGSGRLEIDGRGFAVLAGFRLERDSLILVERAHACAFDGGDVDEDIARAILILDEATSALDSRTETEIQDVLRSIARKRTTLIVAQATDKNLSLASRNVSGVTFTTSDMLSTYDALRPDKLVFTRNAFEQLEVRLGKE